eukprot:Sdes_comp11477_c0_seq1m2760
MESYKTESYLSFLDGAIRSGKFQNLQEIKELWVAIHVYYRTLPLRVFETLSLFVASWNVNGQIPSEDLADLFANRHSTLNAPPQPPLFDMYVIGLQELDSSGSAYISSREPTSRSLEWLQVIASSLSSLGDYQLLCTKQLVGMVLHVFVLGEKRHLVGEIDSEAVGTGLLNYVGNKG